MTTAHRPMTPAEAWLDRAVRSEPRPGLWVALCGRHGEIGRAHV